MLCALELGVVQKRSLFPPKISFKIPKTAFELLFSSIERNLIYSIAGPSRWLKTKSTCSSCDVGRVFEILVMTSMNSYTDTPWPGFPENFCNHRILGANTSCFQQMLSSPADLLKFSLHCLQLSLDIFVRLHAAISPSTTTFRTIPATPFVNEWVRFQNLFNTHKKVAVNMEICNRKKEQYVHL